MPESVGFIGLGIMGRPMAENMARKFAVSGFDVQASRRTGLTGVTVARCRRRGRRVPDCLPVSSVRRGGRGGRARQRRPGGFHDKGLSPYRPEHEPAVPLAPHCRAAGGEGNRVRRRAGERRRGWCEIRITGDHGRRDARHVRALPAGPRGDREDRRPCRRGRRGGHREARQQHDRGDGICRHRRRLCPGAEQWRRGAGTVRCHPRGLGRIQGAGRERAGNRGAGVRAGRDGRHDPEGSLLRTHPRGGKPLPHPDDAPRRTSCTWPARQRGSASSPSPPCSSCGAGRKEHRCAWQSGRTKPHST